MTGGIRRRSLQTLQQEKQPNYGLLLKRANQNKEEAASRYAAAPTGELPEAPAALGEGGEAKMMAAVMPSGSVPCFPPDSGKLGIGEEVSAAAPASYRQQEHPGILLLKLPGLSQASLQHLWDSPHN